MNTIIYLIRHGAVLNPLNLTYGRIRDIVLSDEGKKQIAHLASVIEKRGERPEIIVSSPLTRTKESSIIIQQLFPEVEIVYKEELLESDSKNFVGRPLSWARSLQDPHNPDVQKSLGIYIEPEEKQRNRMVSVINSYVQQFAGKIILFVSHGDPIAFAMDALLHPREAALPINELKPEIYPLRGEAWRLVVDEKLIILSKEKITR